MNCLRLFIENYIVYYNVYCYYCGVFIEKYVYTKFRLKWLLCEWVTWPFTLYMSLSYVWPEAVYWCFTKLHCLPNCLHVCMIRVRSCYHITKFCCSIPYGFWDSYKCKYIAWGCLLLFYKNYIVYQIVYMFLWSVLWVAIMSPSFVTLHILVSEIAKCNAWGYLLLFYENYIVYCKYCGVFTEKYVYTKFCLDWLLCEWVTRPYMSLP